MTERQVSFVSTCKVIVFFHRRGIKDNLWYSNEDCDRFKLASHLSALEVREQILQGSFEGGLGDTLGLGKLFCSKSYSARRAVLKAAVFEEQAWQRLSRQMRLRRGIGDVDSDGSVMALANIAQENSQWAREQAFLCGLSLRSDTREEFDPSRSCATLTLDEPPQSSSTSDRMLLKLNLF